MAAFSQLVLPIAYQYNPQLVLVSAGFDAAVNDPVGGVCGSRVLAIRRVRAGFNVSACVSMCQHVSACVSMCQYFLSTNVFFFYFSMLDAV